jgi:hypothetical protein
MVVVIISGASRQQAIDTEDHANSAGMAAMQFVLA